MSVLFGADGRHGDDLGHAVFDGDHEDLRVDGDLDLLAGGGEEVHVGAIDGDADLAHAAWADGEQDPGLATAVGARAGYQAGSGPLEVAEECGDSGTDDQARGCRHREGCETRQDGDGEQRAGGAAALKKLLPKAKAAKALKSVPDDRYLSLMSLRVFSAGLKHSMVAYKWPTFEEVFLDFEPKRVAAMPDEDLETLLKQTRIIRHWGKIKATRHNAAALVEMSTSHGSFGAWPADWPADNIVGLWDEMQKRFSNLGGKSWPHFLRMAGKDSFVLTADTVKALNK